MDGSDLHGILGIATLLCCVETSMTAMAAQPPMERRQSSHAVSARALDLRAPSSIEPAAPQAYGILPGMHRISGFGSDVAAHNRGDFGGGASVAARSARIPGTVEAFAQRFRREGLPVARLWENHAALVSLGLNSKGKPGIWLVQKTH